MTTPLDRLLTSIIDGYAAEKSGLDDDMIPHLIGLGDQAEELRTALRALHTLQSYDHFEVHGNEATAEYADAKLAIQEFLHRN